ncbi:baculoviral IAP repeat-containing protein 7 isoform X2 [Erpetoichthys calabaricus]|uniref:baculoviral IAP repeat-containing protein 7 isoform X2 n=1 Tax=Erpetoichthys calabaricus TaxID=27687 RepID=UPI00109FEF66|nr:baculoviral IAP repeat-containing protein 7 isoform X2 [Erpetoichthys calabaricus]
MRTHVLGRFLESYRSGEMEGQHVREEENRSSQQWTNAVMSGSTAHFHNMQQNGGLFLAIPAMRSERDRLTTFQSWPSNILVSSAKLAEAGFFFLGSEDKVQCFCCGVILRQWERDDDPMTEHRKHFPACNFIMGVEVGNIPKAVTQTSSDAVDGQILSQIQRLAVEEQVLGGQPAYPEMEEESSRMSSYHNWPPSASVHPQLLARAGFFYTGHSDNVKCFYCDGGLRNWEAGDDPWREHAKWFPRCEFLLHVRGRDYVSNIQDSYFNATESSLSNNSSSEAIATGEITSGQDVVGNLDVPLLLQSPVVQAVLQMGFDYSVVESLVKSKYLLTGLQYNTVSDLVSATLEAEDEERQRSDQSREPPESLSQGAGGSEQRQMDYPKESGLSPEEQLRQLQEERTCKVCMDKVVSVVFVPCGHLVVCTDCATSLHNCPICRAVIRGSVRTFMS